MRREAGARWMRLSKKSCVGPMSLSGAEFVPVAVEVSVGPGMGSGPRLVWGCVLILFLRFYVL